MADGNPSLASPAAQLPLLEEGGVAQARQDAPDGPATCASSYGAAGSSAKGPDPSPAALPDLADRLREAGIYGEYYAYKQKYLQWRKGGSQGAAGELTSSSLARSHDPDAFEFWYPNPSIFKWRFTIAYWKAIFFLVGSLLFTFSSSLSFWGGPGGYEMMVRPSGIGSVFYTVGCYAGYLQLINMNTDKGERVVYFFPDSWAQLCERTNMDSVIGTVAYTVGALVFQIGATTAMYQHRTHKVQLCLVDWPNTVGSALFVIGGVCEHTHNRLYRAGGATWQDPVWWIAHLNLTGSINFLLGSLPFAFPGWGWSGKWTALNFGIGSGAFAISSILMVVMWRANDFGLSLLRQLNFAMQARGQISVARPAVGSPRSGEQEHIGVRINLPAGHDLSQDAARHAPAEPTLSLRGTLFIVLYCWFAFVAIMNCLVRQEWYVHSANKHLFRHGMDLAMQMFVLLLISLVLVLHSAVADVPDEQPFHCAMITLRIVLFAGATIQTILFVAFFINPHYDNPLSLLSLQRLPF